MPLIIAVVAIIVIFVVMHDNKKDRMRTNANMAIQRRKTNARLERIVLDGFMKEGYTFEESYKMTLDEMVSRGYDPCIPIKAYGTDWSGQKVIFNGEESSFIGNVEKYDSDEVKTRRELLKRENKTITDELLYSNFPTNNFEYITSLKEHTLKYQMIKKGSCFTHPKYGTCQVIDYSYGLNKTSGYYVARVISTGEIVRDIKIGDKQIRIIK